MSRLQRVALAALTALGLLVYLVVVDLGISAGRIHHGVSVQGIDLGGLTEEEAAAVLRKQAAELRTRPLAFGREGMPRLTVEPRQLGWRPRPLETAREALSIGRDSGPLTALWMRLRGWVGGVQVPWRGHLQPGAVTRRINRWEQEAASRGLEINRGRLRYKIRQAVLLWERQSLYRMPLAPGS